MSSPARENPFRTCRVLELRYRLDPGGWDRLLERFERLGCRAALVGPEGSGKTTLLEDLGVRLERRGWRVVPLRLAPERRRPTPREWARIARAGRRRLVSVDGAEQLSWYGWRRLERASRRAGGLLVTLHRPGRLPALHRHRTTPRLLEELVADLVGRERVEALRGELEILFAAHRGNLRDCLRALYDQWAQGRCVTAATLRATAARNDLASPASPRRPTSGRREPRRRLAPLGSWR